MVYQDTNNEFQQYNQDEENPQAPSSTGTGSQTQTVSTAPQAQNQPSNPQQTGPNGVVTPTTTPSNPNQQQQGSGRFTNLKKYINANQQGTQKLGQKLEGTITSEADKVKQGIYNSQNQFNVTSQTAENELNKTQDYNKKLLEGSALDLTSNEQDFNNFRNILTGKTQNPTENVTKFQSNVNRIQNISQLPTSEQGRNQLLSEFSAGPERQYSTGQRGFDQLLIQSSPNIVKNLQTKGADNFKDTQGNLNQTLATQQQAIQRLKDIGITKQQELKTSLGDFNDQQQGAFGNLYKNINDAKTSATNTQANDVKQLQDLIKSGRIDTKTAQKYGIDSYLDLGDDKVQDLVDYGYDRLQGLKTNDVDTDNQIQEREQLEYAKKIYTDPTILANIDRRLVDVNASLNNSKGSVSNIDNIISDRTKLADYGRFGKSAPTVTGINKYYDQLIQQFQKSNPNIFNGANPGTQGAGELSNIDKMRQSDITRLPELEKQYLADNQINLNKFLKPEDLANIAANVQAKDSDISFADVASQGNRSQLEALMKLSGRTDINLGEKQGKFGANFDASPMEQNIIDIIKNKTKEGYSDYTDLAPIRKALFDKQAALGGALTGGISGGLIAGFGDTGKEMLDDTGLTGNSETRLANYGTGLLGNPLTSTLQLLRDSLSAANKVGDRVGSVANSAIDETKQYGQDTLNMLQNPFEAQNLANLLSGANTQGLFQGASNIGDKVMDATNISTGNSALDKLINGPTQAGINFAQNIGSAASKAANAIASIFCHTGDTRVKMADGSIKEIKDVQLGEELELGGKIVGLGEAYGDKLYDYKGTTVSGDHAVYEDGEWVRVRDSEFSKRLKNKKELVYPLATENMLILTEDGTIWSDMQEVNDTYNKTDRQILKELNNNNKRNNKIKKYLEENGNY